MFLPALVLAAAVSSPSPAAAVPQVAPAITARAKQWLHRLQVSDVDRSQLTKEMNAALTDTLVKSVSQEIAPLGDPTGFTASSVQHGAGFTAYVYKVDFPHDTTLYFVFALDDVSGKISGLRFTNAQ